MENFEEFTHWLRAHDKSDFTCQAYTNDLRLFRKWFEEHTGEEMSSELVTPLDVRSYKDHLLEAGFAPSTCARKLAALSQFFRWAQDAGLAQFDPTEDIGRPSRVKQPPKWLDKSEKHRLLREAQKAVQLGELKAQGDHSKASLWRNRRDLAVIVLMLNTGLRVREVARLKLFDLSIGERSGQVKVLGKGAKGRTVPLNKTARRALSSWLEVRPEADCHALFVSQRGTPLSPRSVQEVVAKYAKASGLKGVSPHTLRHTFGKGLLDAGVSLDKVAKLLGHSSIETTKIYTTPSRADLKEAVERLV